MLQPPPSRHSSRFSAPTEEEDNDFLLAEFASPESQRLNRIGELSSTKKMVSFPDLEGMEDNGKDLNEINHSGMLSRDFAQFLDDEALSDFKIKVVSGKDYQREMPDRKYVEIPAHRIVLAARCPYFQSKFCRDWKDGQSAEAAFPEFSEHSMKEFLRYIYTGKLKVELTSIMGVLKIASFLGVESLMAACKHFLSSGLFNVFDLCLLYREVRETHNDFEEMRSFFTNLIP